LGLVLGGGDHGHAELRVVADPERLLEPARVDRGHAPPGDAVGDLVGQALGHEAGTDERDLDRPAFGLALLERGVDEDHSAASTGAIRLLISSMTSESGAHLASFSEISV